MLLSANNLSLTKPFPHCRFPTRGLTCGPGIPRNRIASEISSIGRFVKMPELFWISNAINARDQSVFEVKRERVREACRGVAFDVTRLTVDRGEPQNIGHSVFP